MTPDGISAACGSRSAKAAYTCPLGTQSCGIAGAGLAAGHCARGSLSSTIAHHSTSDPTSHSLSIGTSWHHWHHWHWASEPLPHSKSLNVYKPILPRAGYNSKESLSRSQLLSTSCVTRGQTHCTVVLFTCVGNVRNFNRVILLS